MVMPSFINIAGRRRIGAFFHSLRRRPRPIDKLDVRSAYRLWAPLYQAETVTSFLDEVLAQEMLADLSYKHLLDAGCGIGRRIVNLPNATGLDLSPEMLKAGRAQNVVSGDIREMPFPNACFDMVWCRLVLGHLSDPLAAYREFARVSVPGGHVFITDFHPDAVAAGHTRSFTDKSGRVHEIEHYVHQDHVALAEQAGLSLAVQRDGTVGDNVRSFYADGRGLKAFQRDLGLRLVAAFLFRL